MWDDLIGTPVVDDGTMATRQLIGQMGLNGGAMNYQPDGMDGVIGSNADYQNKIANATVRGANPLPQMMPELGGMGGGLTSEQSNAIQNATGFGTARASAAAEADRGGAWGGIQGNPYFMGIRPQATNVLGYQGSFMGGSRGYTDDSAGQAWDQAANRNVEIQRMLGNQAIARQSNANEMYKLGIMSNDRQAAIDAKTESDIEHDIIAISKLPPGPMRDAAMARARSRSKMPMDQFVESQVGPATQNMPMNAVLSALPGLINSATDIPTLRNYLTKTKGITTGAMEGRMNEMRSRGVLGDLFSHLAGISQKSVSDLPQAQQAEYGLLQEMTGRKPVANDQRQMMQQKLVDLEAKIKNLGVLASFTGEDQELRREYLRTKQLLAE